MDVPLQAVVSTALTVLSLGIALYAVLVNRRGQAVSQAASQVALLDSQKEAIFAQRLALVTESCQEIERKYAALTVQFEAISRHAERCEAELARLRDMIERRTPPREAAE